MTSNASSQTVALLTAKSVPVHALISSGVSPSHTSMRVRPVVLSTSNTAWQKRNRAEKEGGKENKG